MFESPRPRRTRTSESPSSARVRVRSRLARTEQPEARRRPGRRVQGPATFFAPGARGHHDEPFCSETQRASRGVAFATRRIAVKGVVDELRLDAALAKFVDRLLVDRERVPSRSVEGSTQVGEVLALPG